jgi:hypothetical protein
VAVVLPLYLLELHRGQIPWLALAKGVAVPLACGAGVAAVSLMAARVVTLDLLACVIAGCAVLAALAMEGSRMRETVRRLRTTVSTPAG